MNRFADSAARLASVDALRGLAALMVLMYHARLLFSPGTAAAWLEHGATADPVVLFGYASTVFSFGGYGVPLFFVLSGYCIHRRSATRLAAGNTSAPNWREFARRRLVRLYPVYVAGLLLTYLVDQFLLARLAFPSPLDHSLGTFLASLVTLQGVAAPKFGTNNVFWTLAVEMHLYAAYPILFYMSRRAGPWAALGLALGGGVAWAVFRRALDLSFPMAENGGVIFLGY